MNELKRHRNIGGDHELEAVAANIIHQIGDALYDALPAGVAHEYFVAARQATNDRAIDFAKELISGYAERTAEPTSSKPDRALEMAHRLVASALMMKRQYQDAGLLMAREFCTEYGIDVHEIEQKLRQSGKPFGRVDPVNPRLGQIDATEDGRAWFWVGRSR